MGPMISMWFILALIFELIATAGFIVFIVKQQKWMFRLSYWLLVVGFIFHTIFLGCRYYSLGAAPVLDLKSALSFFSWSIIGVYLVIQSRFKLRVLGSFVAPLAAFFMTISSAVPGTETPVKPIFKSLWLTLHVGTVFVGECTSGHFMSCRGHVSDSGKAN